MQTQILRRKDVEAMTGLSKSTIYKMISNGTFPAAIRIGDRAVGWRLSDIDRWIDQRAVTVNGGCHGSK